jgi:hypothetical protein
MNRTRDALISILEYNWNDEKRDYWENCSDEPDDNQREGHIFLSLVVLAEFLGLDLNGSDEEYDHSRAKEDARNAWQHDPPEGG